MRAAQDGPVQGRTSWRRFAALLVPSAVVAGAIVVGMANGAVAASFAVSGQSFKVKADRLEGTGFVQYGGVAERPDGSGTPVAVSGIREARLFNLCQSVKVPGVPVVLTINAGGDRNNPARATNLLLDVTELRGDAEFTNIQIGRDAGQLSGDGDLSGSFGQSADRVTIRNLEQVAMSTQAGTFTLNGLRLRVNVGEQARECFGWNYETGRP